MSTLKTHNLQSSDSGSVNIALAPNAGMVVTGISTFSNDIVIPDKIIHSGDTNTAIRFPSADTITAETGGLERFRITSDGAVLLGETSASNAESFLINTSDSGKAIIKLTNSTTGTGTGDGFEFGLNASEQIEFVNKENTDMFFATNNSERLRIASDGKVGLGTDNPQTIFHISDNVPTIRFTDENSTGVPDCEIGGAGGNIDISADINGEKADSVIRLNVDGSEALKINSDGYLTLNNITRPTVGHTGNEPLINGFSSYFYHEVHRCITDMRSLCEGTHAGYILLVPAWPGSNTTGKKFYGTIMCDRGNTGGGNSTQVAKIHASTAYNNDKFYVEVDRHSQYICGASKVTYGGVAYLAVRFNSGGGGPTYNVYVDGKHRGTDANFLRVVRENEVTVDDKHYGALATNPSGPPICGAFIKNMTGSTFDSGVLEGGDVVYQYAPSGQNSPYNTGTGYFTARVNGLYLVTGGILVQHNTGRLEGKLEWYNNSSWQTYVNFNGTGTTYDGPTFTVMIPLKEGYAVRMARSSGNAYNSAHPQHYFGVHLLNALERDDVPH